MRAFNRVSFARMMETVEVGTRTDAGGREDNEDACAVLVCGPLEVIILADGAGGHAGGEVASERVVTASSDYFGQVDHSQDPSVLLQGALHAAHRAVRDEMKSRPRLRDMRSTALIVLGSAKAAWVGHVGDSRAYLIRDGAAQRLTRDDTLVQSLVDLGQIDDEAAKKHSKANVLMQSVGDPKTLEYHVTGPIEVREGDRIVACSDGLWEVMTDAELATIASDGDPSSIAKRLIDHAVASTPSDNITVGVMHWRLSDSRPTTATGRGAGTSPDAKTNPRRSRSMTNWIVLIALLAIVLAAVALRLYRDHARSASPLRISESAAPARYRAE